MLQGEKLHVTQDVQYVQQVQVVFVKNRVKDQGENERLHFYNGSENLA